MKKPETSELEGRLGKETRIRKERSGLPQVNLVDAIKYIKTAYNQIRGDLKSVEGMAEVMGITKEYGSRVFGELQKDYGLIEQERGGWRITDLGRRVANDEKDAIIAVLSKNDIMKHLYDNFKDQSVSKDFLESYVKKKRLKYNIAFSTVAERFLQAMTYVNNLGKGVAVDKVTKKTEFALSKMFRIIQLQYTLNPPKDDDIPDLAETVANDLKNEQDVAIKTLAENIEENKDNKDVLRALVNSLVKIIAKKIGEQSGSE